jgi:hypothetical protein
VLRNVALDVSRIDPRAFAPFRRDSRASVDHSRRPDERVERDLIAGHMLAGSAVEVAPGGGDEVRWCVEVRASVLVERNRLVRVGSLTILEPVSVDLQGTVPWPPAWMVDTEWN